MNSLDVVTAAMGEPWFWNGSDNNEDDVSIHPTPQQVDLLWMVLARCQDAVPVVRVRAIGTTPTLPHFLTPSPPPTPPLHSHFTSTPYSTSLLL